MHCIRACTVCIGCLFVCGTDFGCYIVRVCALYVCVCVHCTCASVLIVCACVRIVCVRVCSLYVCVCGHCMYLCAALAQDVDLFTHQVGRLRHKGVGIVVIKNARDAELAAEVCV